MATSNDGAGSNWLIYGANGYTGALIAEEAVKRGHRPVLAGRNRDGVLSLAKRLGLSSVVFDVGDRQALLKAIEGRRLVLNCAGPFADTAAPVLEACLDARAHYLDITGEIDVFSACHERSGQAKDRGICVVPGVGFDVVPTDGVAAMLKETLPDAVALILAFEASGGPSVGTAKTSVAGLARGGRVRRRGSIVEVPLAFKTRTFVREGRERTAMTIPWGDVFTAFITTGIPDIEVYMVASPNSIRSAKRLNWVRPLLRFPWVVRFLQQRMEMSVKAPSPERRAQTNAYIWGEARDAAGHTARMEIETPNGYDLTVSASLGVASWLLDPERNQPPPRLGYLTPSQLMGARYVLSLPGVVIKAGA